MKIRLLGWESENLRCPDSKVRFSADENVPKVTLIQMPNGTGKTTTLSLLKAALTGAAEKWGSDTVAEFAPRDQTVADGKFSVRLLIDERHLTIEMTLNFIENNVTYRTTSPLTGGVRDGWHPPTEARRFLTEKFVGLFVFDGELAYRMLDPTQQRADEAIDALCQLDLLDHVATVSEVAWERTAKDKGAKTESGLTAAKTKERNLADRLKKLSGANKEAREKLAVIKKSLEAFDKALVEKLATDEKNRKALEQLKLDEKTREIALEQANGALMGVVRQPQALSKYFSQGLLSLKKSMDVAKLPDTTSKQFFVEMANQEECICGRPIGSHEREVILKKSVHYLGDDISGVLNSLKQDIESLVGTKDNEALGLTDAVACLVKAEDEYHKTQTRRRALEQTLLEGADEGARELHKKLKAAEVERDKLEVLLKEMDRAPIESDDERTTVCIAFIERQLIAIRKKIAEITGTVDLRKRTDIIKNVMARAKARARDHLRAVLVTECNAHLERILVASPVSIKGIQNSITLQGQKQASVGQTLAVGYTFLTSVLGRGAHQFPLVVDSPAGPLDGTVRAEIGAMIPKLCEQFVAFTINTERAGFVPALEKAASGSMSYLTLFRKTAGTKDMLKSLPKEGVTETSNAILVEGKGYFDAFAIEREA